MGSSQSDDFYAFQRINFPEENGQNTVLHKSKTRRKNWQGSYESLRRMVWIDMIH